MNVNVEELKQARERLAAHVRVLAGDIGERNIYRPRAYQQAADYIARVLREGGYEVQWQRYEVQRISCANLIVERSGQRWPDQIVVVGAHYDSVYGSPGANDNGSGVAALLELARRFASRQLARTLRFVAFANEEPPFFPGEQMGSRVYAKACRARGENLRMMISLETIGWFSDRPGSQKYPPLFSFFYPDCGNFIAFVGNMSSRALMGRAARVFRSHCDVPLETCATFAFVPGVDWSDHGSFWRHGYRAFMITDTAPYRYPHYHEPTDTADKVNYEMLARVASGVEAVVRELANGRE
ncbi:MAG: M28 family peptidase [Verrucomicrobiae bacterium]|nr:M28 family peptidase [Verrucomicrobiae bacterium]